MRALRENLPYLVRLTLESTSGDDSCAQARRINSGTVGLRDDDVISRDRRGSAPSDATRSVATGTTAQEQESALRGVLAVEESAFTAIS